LKVRKIKFSTYSGKYADIERENRILLDKMSNIMQDNKPKLYNPSKKPSLLIQNRKIRSSKSQSRCAKEKPYENNSREPSDPSETPK